MITIVLVLPHINVRSSKFVKANSASTREGSR